MRRKPNGRWFARVSCGYTVDGRQRRVSKELDSEAEAEAWIAAMSSELSLRRDYARGVTLRALWEAYKVARADRLTRATMTQYRWYMEGSSADGSTHVTWLDVLGERDVSTIVPAEVQRHLNTMAREKARHAKKAISAVFTWGVRADILASNPIAGVRFEYPRAGDMDGFSEDPFAAVDMAREVWGPSEVMECFDRIRGLPLEPAWLVCVGAGLRVEEALALRGMDVRRVEAGGREVTQVAVHAARTVQDGVKTTKTRQSVRVVGVMEPMGLRFWELASAVDRDSLVCPVSAQNQNKRWRGYFEPPSTSKHAPRREGANNKGRLHGLRYVPLSKMRNTHVTLMQEAGVPDSLNALVHGHSQQTERRHYMRPDVAFVTSVEDYLGYRRAQGSAPAR